MKARRYLTILALVLILAAQILACVSTHDHPSNEQSSNKQPSDFDNAD
jgi:hypothetical protein